MPNGNRTTFMNPNAQTLPFKSAEEVWFWFMAANQARLDGAEKRDNGTGPSRPCEPVDVLRVLDRLYRHKTLNMEHFRILRFYGDKQMRPDPWRPREARAAVLWKEAMRALQQAFVEKEIIVLQETSQPVSNDPQQNMVWMHQAASNLSQRWGLHDGIRG